VCGPVLASALVDGGGDEVAVVRATRKWSPSFDIADDYARGERAESSRILVWV
jgi:hypothetical protein